MAQEQGDLLEVLRSELSFLEQGGYGRSVGTPWKWTSTFQHSPSCINFNRSQPARSCSECPLIAFVPSEARTRDVPCHHIAIGPTGETVGRMEREGDVLELEHALRNWLRTAIADIERQRAGRMSAAA